MRIAPPAVNHRSIAASYCLKLQAEFAPVVVYEHQQELFQEDGEQILTGLPTHVLL